MQNVEKYTTSPYNRVNLYKNINKNLDLVIRKNST